jgi:uncharacterized protein YndB with AHSA1/START domain
MQVEQGTLIDKEVKIAAPQEQVFQFLIDPKKMSRWMGQNVALDPRPGGKYRIDLNGRNIMVGEFVEVEAPSKVVMTFGWEGDDAVPPGSTRLEFQLSSEGEETTLRLRHYGLSPERAESHTEGWIHYMERLAVAAVGDDPGPDPYAETDEMEE